MKPETAIILAGGMGTRLRPALSDRPKVLAPIASRPFLDYLLAYLSRQAIRHVILAVGYLAEQVVSFAGDGQRWGLRIEYSFEEQPLGTAGATRLASQGLSDPFFTFNGDTLFLVSLDELWREHTLRKVSATVSLRKIALEANDHYQRGCVKLDEKGMITAFDEKPAQSMPASTSQILTNAGIYVFSSETFSDLMPDLTSSQEVGSAVSRSDGGQAVSFSLEKQVFPMLAERQRLAGCLQEGYFVDIGTPDSLAAFERDIQKGVFVYGS